MFRMMVAVTTATCVLLSGCASLGVGGSGGPITERFEKLAFYTGKAATSVEDAYTCLSKVAGLEEDLKTLERSLETCKTDEEKEALRVKIKALKDEALKGAQAAADAKKQLTDDQKKLVRQTWINLVKAGEYYAQYISDEAPALLAEAQKISGSASNPAVAMRYAADIPNVPNIVPHLQAIVVNVGEQPVLIAAILKPLTEIALANGVELPSKEEVAQEVSKELSAGIK